MLRSWPESLDSQPVIVRLKTGVLVVMITGIFSVIMSIVIPAVIWARFNHKLPEEIGTAGFVFLITMLLLFGFIAIGGFSSSVKNYLKPGLRFVANREGIFMNITVHGQEAFFVPWNEIVEIRQIEINIAAGGRGRYIDDAIGIFLSETCSEKLPKVIKGVIGSEDNYIAFAQGTIDVALDDMLRKLNSMKRVYAGDF